MKPKEQTKLTDDKSTNQSKAAIIFSDLISKRKRITTELYDSVDYNNLNFEYVGPSKSASFYEYMDSNQLFDAIKNNQIKFSEVKNKQNKFLNKLNEVKIGEITGKQKKVIDNLNKFYNSEAINFLRDYIEMLSDPNCNAKQNETKGTGLKY